MRDFMPCAGCDEPEACEIVSRCLEPAPRMLTDEELADCCGGCRTTSAINTWMRRAIKRFCEVNGIALAAGVTAAPPPMADTIYGCAEHYYNGKCPNCGRTDGVGGPDGR